MTENSTISATFTAEDRPHPTAQRLPTGLTLRSLVTETVQAHPERPAITYRLAPAATPDGRPADGWHTLTWNEAAHVLLDVLDRLDDLAPADTVAILSDTDARYPLLELALGLSGRSIQPLYTTSTAAELAHAMKVTGAEFLVTGASCQEQAAGLGLRTVALSTLVPLPGIDAAPAVLPADVEPFDTGPVRSRLHALPPRSPHTPLLYLQSTATTGPARVIEISESAMLASVLAVRNEADRHPTLLSFLPTAHISERLITTYASLAIAGHTWYGNGLDTMAEDLATCHPTVLLAPPLLFEAMRTQAREAAATSPLGRLLLAAAERTAAAALAAGRTSVTRRGPRTRLFGRSLRRSAGLGALTDAFVGTAPMPRELAAWWDAAGIPARNVYGQTEVAGATSITARTGAAFATVGPPLPGVDIDIGPGDELLVRSPSAFTRYVGDPEATARTLADGWLHTGDRAARAANGEITLLGRIQALIPIPGGAPLDLERLTARIAEHTGPADIVLIPDHAHHCLTLYLAYHPADIPAHLLRTTQNLRLLPPDDHRRHSLTAHLARLAPALPIRHLALFDGAFSASSGEVGPTGKPRPWRIHQLHSTHLTDTSACLSAGTGPSRDHPHGGFDPAGL